jgi:hypothetical protein
MKIRNGFVSNSSSSSFCIYGVCVESSSLANKEEDIDSPSNIKEMTLIRPKI